MKIGILYDAVYPWIRGGGEKHIQEIALHLVQRGHEVHLFGLQFWEGDPDYTENGIHYHGIAQGGELYNQQRRRTLGPPLRFAFAMITRLPKYQLHTFDVLDVLAFPFLSVPTFWVSRLLWFRRVPWVLTWLEVWGTSYWLRYMGWKGSIGAVIERLAAWVAPRHLCISPRLGSVCNNWLECRLNGSKSSRAAILSARKIRTQHPIRPSLIQKSWLCMRDDCSPTNESS